MFPITTGSFRTNMRRITAGIAAGLLLSTMAATALSGSASAQPTGGMERFTIINASPTSRGQVIATGAFNAVGSSDAATVDNGGHDTFVFPNGTFAVSRTDNPGGAGDFNPLTCVGHFSGTGTYVITAGTGAYVGISGSGTYSFRGTIVAAHGPNGCTHNEVVLVVLGRASGPISFS